MLTVALLTASLLALGVSLWLMRRLAVLTRRYRTLAERLKSAQDDIAGLCSAAVEVDKRLAADELLWQQMAKPSLTVTELPSVMEPVAADGDYGAAIRRIRDGADAEQLVRELGLTRDEAMLLIRIHGC